MNRRFCNVMNSAWYCDQFVGRQGAGCYAFLLFGSVGCPLYVFLYFLIMSGDCGSSGTFSSTFVTVTKTRLLKYI